MLAEEIQAALPGQRRIAIVIARAGRVGEGVIGFIPMAGIGFVRFFSSQLRSQPPFDG
jgi:hypothetical protein